MPVVLLNKSSGTSSNLACWTLNSLIFGQFCKSFCGSVCMLTLTNSSFSIEAGKKSLGRLNILPEHFLRFTMVNSFILIRFLNALSGRFSRQLSERFTVSSKVFVWKTPSGNVLRLFLLMLTFFRFSKCIIVFLRFVQNMALNLPAFV